MPNPQCPTSLLSFGAAVASHFPNKTCISLTDQLVPFITLTADHQFVPFIKPPMATRAFSRSKFAFFSSILLQNLKTTPIKSSPMLLKSTELELESWRFIRGLRLYHDGRPRGPLWRVKKLIGKEALFVISGLKRFEDDEEMLVKFVNTPVLRLLKMDMIVVLTELKRQEEVALAIKDLIIALARSKKMEDVMLLCDSMKKEDLFPDSQTYTEVVRGFLNSGCPADAMNIYEDMKQSPDPPEDLRKNCFFSLFPLAAAELVT
ncbi:hypothetical protein ACFXTO_006271 [Malus domestica]